MLKCITNLVVDGFRPLNVFSGRARHNEIDGLRGWAALSVLMSHLFIFLFGVLIPGVSNPLTGFIFDGRLAVFIFFVLSGDALSFTYFNGGGERSVVKLAIKRYLRLSIPIAAICILILVLAALGCVMHVPAAAAVHSEHWLGSFPAAPFDFKRYFNYFTWRVFVNDAESERIDPFLWTMQYEMVGSFAVFFLLLIRKYVARFSVVLFCISIFLLSGKNLSAFGCFTFGVLFGEFRRNKGFGKSFPFSKFVWPAALLLLAVIDGVTQSKGLLYDRKALLAVPIVFAAYSCPSLCNFLNNGLSRLLGVISFPMYLVQYPVIISFTSWTILSASKEGVLTPLVAVELSMLSLVVTLLASALFVPVEVFTKWIGNISVQWLIKPDGADAARSDA